MVSQETETCFEGCCLEFGLGWMVLDEAWELNKSLGYAFMKIHVFFDAQVKVKSPQNLSLILSEHFR